MFTALELADCTATIVRQVRAGEPESVIVETVAMALNSSETIRWPTVDVAVAERWGSWMRSGELRGKAVDLNQHRALRPAEDDKPRKLGRFM
jgi:hypothetical protein